MTIDDLYEVFVNALYDPVTGKRTKDTRDGLRAVLETHVKPMLAEAWRAANANACMEMNDGTEYAARIISQLTDRTDG